MCQFLSRWVCSGASKEIRTFHNSCNSHLTGRNGIMASFPNGRRVYHQINLIASKTLVPNQSDYSEEDADYDFIQIPVSQVPASTATATSTKASVCMRDIFVIFELFSGMNSCLCLLLFCVSHGRCGISELSLSGFRISPLSLLSACAFAIYDMVCACFCSLCGTVLIPLLSSNMTTTQVKRTIREKLCFLLVDLWCDHVKGVTSNSKRCQSIHFFSVSRCKQ